MAIVLNGTTGITSVNGSAAAPSVTGTDTDTGIVYGTNTITLSTGGTAGLVQDASQQVGIGTSAPDNILHLYASAPRLTFTATNNSSGARYNTLGTATTGAHRFQYGGTDVLIAGITGYTTALQGASSVAGTGITFPATQSASTDANTLDDYEEGTWTPVIGSESGGTSATYNFNSGVYRKIGSMVYLQFGFNLATLTAGSGTVTISGLPFAGISRGAYQEPSNPIQAGQLTNSAYAGKIYCFVGNSQSVLFFRYMNNSDSIVPASVLQGGTANVGTYMNGIIVYCTS